MKRQELVDIHPERLVSRASVKDGIVHVIRKTIQTAMDIRHRDASSLSEWHSRLIVVKGGAGVGKSVLLQMLARELPNKVPVRVTKIINIKSLMEGEDQPSVWHDAFAACADKALAHGAIPDQSLAMCEILKESEKPLVVLLDNLEALNNPLFDNRDSERDERVLNIKNLLLRALLRLIDLPVIIIAAVRVMPDQEMPYLSEIEFQDAMYEVKIENTEADVNTVLGINDSDSRTEQCGGSLLVAAVRGPNWDDPDLRRMLIDEFMAREHPDQRAAFERMFTELSKKPVVNMSLIKEKAAALELSTKLQARIVARLKATGYLSSVHDAGFEGRFIGYRVYPPLANLLREAESAP